MMPKFRVFLCRKLCGNCCENRKEEVKSELEKVSLLPVDASFNVRRGNRWTRQTCADGLIRTVYEPISPKGRMCQDCHHYEISQLKPGPKFPMIAWCLRDCPKVVPLELKGDPFELPKTCGRFLLVGITKSYRPWVSQTAPNAAPGHEVTPFDFCRAWNGE